MENKEELIGKIKADLNNGLTWQAVRDKHNLKSDYLLRLATNAKTAKDYNYINIRIDKNDLNGFDYIKLWVLNHYLERIANILKNNKGIKKTIAMVEKEMNSRA